MVELLIVVTIIGVLASLAFPAFNGAMNAAKKTQASAMANQLKTAVTNFYTDYGYYPTQPQRQELDNKVLYKILIGKDTENNPRGIAYMEFKANDLDNPQEPTVFVDPWYRSVKSLEQNYHILVDHDYDNEIELSQGQTDHATPPRITASVAVWDPGIPTHGKPFIPPAASSSDSSSADSSSPSADSSASSSADSSSASGDSASPDDATTPPASSLGWTVNRISSPKIIKTW